ncbi:CRISPR-associated helicase/endonuclease Cas3 [Salinispora pacifica]|uniref:Cas3 protein I-U-Csx17 n=1 Tax=Salinispora pacifica TaxID=351187 RepID=A0A059U6I9_SALPI|nr:CRISPR-associated helicase/endonuclease Cas3 [Salinispora pacifica]AHZ55866.1 Cas3 protein I-U-Csx17 [Salinispora pacifica]AHZ55868.1 Cas3 protein I-U-Csx17 [Salinispora pacifica]
MSSFEAFFEQATGVPPYGYQARLARDGLPAVVQAPTGSGKTAVILAWLWRRLHGPVREGTPRRLVFALPQRTLVEQVAAEVRRWLTSLDLSDEVALHVVMGGEGRTQRQWRLDMHHPAIVVGTVDSLVSKALNRGYGVSRAVYPIDFALVTNGAQWIVDEVQLCRESTTTLRQLAGFVAAAGSGWPTAEPLALTCMSATVSESLLDTVDNPLPGIGDVLRIVPEERVGELATRLNAKRTIRRLPAEPGDHKAIAGAVRDRHRPGTLTLVVVNTVATARGVYTALRDSAAPRTLLHSRFRGVERERLVGQVVAEPGELGRIVVSTQVVEAGVDISAAVLVTEAAPWPSVVQRAGRCNRTGRVADAELWWLPPAKHSPYERADIEAAVDELAGLEGVGVTGEELLARQVAVTEPEISVIRRGDLLSLFDTAPDLAGADLDVAPYVRDADDLDVQLAWGDWTPTDTSGRPPAEAKAPPAEWRCRVPLGELKALRNRGAVVWRFDQAAGQWAQVTEGQPARPGEVLVVSAKYGGYDPQVGLDSSVKKPVVDCPSLDARPDPAAGTDPASGGEDAYQQDDASVAQREWLPLDQHSDDVRGQCEALLAVLQPSLPAAVKRAVVTAGYAHDAGKCHDAWQEALCALAPREERERVELGRPWAKSAVNGRLNFPRDGSFRHELVSLLLLDGPLRALLESTDAPDLVRYLVLAHHGKLRLQVRGPDDTDAETLLGLKNGETVQFPDLLGQPAGELTVDLDQFSFGGDSSWTRTALGLRDRYGPFILAYLETLVRVADWRASAGMGEAA